MVMSLQGWHELKCPMCDTKDFIPVISIIWQQGMGSSVKPNGYRCSKCHMAVDQAKMIAVAKKQDAEQKIKDLEAELG